MRKRVNIYGKQGPLTIPAYSVADVATHLSLPPTTVASWVHGRRYRTDGGVQTFKPVVISDDVENRRRLSFRNLVEVHVLSALRRQHNVHLHEIRKAIAFLRKHFQTDHPLAEKEMLTDGKELFVREYGKLINASKEGQLAIREALEIYLSRIERTPDGMPIRIFPFHTGTPERNAPTAVFIDPTFQFGRPCLVGTGIPTAVIAERYKAGETIGDLARDYRRRPQEIEEAIRYELPRKAA
jgi:uncharacterized protein (DUF433 family)